MSTLNTFVFQGVSFFIPRTENNVVWNKDIFSLSFSCFQIIENFLLTDIYSSSSGKIALMFFA